MGTHKSFKEALISALISADLPQNLPNFCSESAPGRAQGKSNESPKTPRQLLKRIPSAHIQPLRSPRGSLKHPKISPKNFHQFMGTYIGHASECCPSTNRAANPAVKPTVKPAEGYPKERSAAPPERSTPASPEPQKVPRKATTGQNARRCKYSLLGIQ